MTDQQAQLLQLPGAPPPLIVRLICTRRCFAFRSLSIATLVSTVPATPAASCSPPLRCPQYLAPLIYAFNHRPTLTSHLLFHHHHHHHHHRTYCTSHPTHHFTHCPPLSPHRHHSHLPLIPSSWLPQQLSTCGPPSHCSLWSYPAQLCCATHHKRPPLAVPQLPRRPTPPPGAPSSPPAPPPP